MPIAAHIAAVSAHDAPGTAARSGVPGKAKPASAGVAADSGGGPAQDFGSTFRAQTAIARTIPSKVAPQDVETDASGGAKKNAAKLDPTLAREIAQVTEGVDLSKRTENGTEAADVAETEAGAPDGSGVSLPQARLAANLKNALIETGSGAAEVDPAAGDAGSGAKLHGKSPAHDADRTKGKMPVDAGKQEQAVAGSLPMVAVAAAPVAAAAMPVVPDGQKRVHDAAQGGPVPGCVVKVSSAQSLIGETQNALPGAAGQGDGASDPGNALKGAPQGVDSKAAATQPADAGAVAAKNFGDVAKSGAAQLPTAQHPAAAHAAASGLISTAIAAAPSVGHGVESVNPAQHVATPVQVGASVTPVAVAAPVAAASAYDRIDQGAAPVVLHSGAQHVSVGVQDPTLGWVEIKTQNTGGHVDATLVTASGQSHDALAAQLPAMAQFLQQRDVRVNALAVHHELPSGQNGAAGNGSGGGANYGGGAGHSSHPGPGQGSGGERGTAYGGLSSRLLGNAGVGVSEDAGLRPVSYISVRA